MDAFIWLFGIVFVLCLFAALWDEYIGPLVEKIAYAAGYVIGVLVSLASIVGVIVALVLFVGAIVS